MTVFNIPARALVRAAHEAHGAWPQTQPRTSGLDDAARFSLLAIQLPIVKIS